MLGDSVPVRRGSASSPVPRAPRSPHLPTQSQPFSASDFDEFMGLPTSNSHVRVSPAVSAAVEATSATGTSISRKLRSFPWSRSSADKKQQQKRATISARERIVSSAGPDAPRPGPSILKTSSSSSLPTKNGPGGSPSLPMGFPAPPPSTTSSSASISTGTSFASTSMFASFSSSTATDDAGWHSEATSVSLNSSPEMGAGGFSNDSLIKLRNSRRAAKESSSDAAAAAAPRSNTGVRPFSVLSDIVERDNEDGRASMYDVLSMYSVPTSTHANGPDVPVRRVSTPIPPAVALMLASEPATPPRQKRWSTSSIDESSSSSPSGRDHLLGAEADDEISPRRRRNSFDSPGTRTKTEAAAAAQRRPASSIRIPSMRFDGISMEAMFAEVEARMNRQLAAKQLAGAVAATESTTAAANLPEAVKKQARRKSRVMSLQEPLSFEISTPVFASASNAATTSRREETIVEEDEEAEEEADILPPPVVAPSLHQQLPHRTSSRPEPLNVNAANSIISSRWSPRSAPLQSTGPFFASSPSPAVVVTATCESPTSPTPAKGAFSALLPPVVEPEQGTNSAAGQASPRLQGSIPELLVCPPSPPERPKRRAPPPPPLRLGPNPSSSSSSSSSVVANQHQQRPFPKMQPASPASLTSPVTRPTTMVNGETKVTLVQTEKKFVRLSTRAQPARRKTDRGRTFSVPVQPTRVMQQSPQTPSTPTFEITPPPPDSPVEVAEQPMLAAESVALPISEPSTPVRRFMDEGAADLSPARSVSPTPSSTPTVTTTPYHPPNVLRTDYHPALSNLTVAYPNSDDSSSECEESFQDMLIRLNRPHTPPRNKANKPPVEESAPAVATSPTSSLTKSAMQAHNTSHSRLSMLARELGEAMAAKENMPPAVRRHRSLARPSSTDTRRYSKLFAAGEVDLDRFGFELEGAPVLVSQAEPQSPTLMHHLRPIDSEHGHGDDDESWTAAQGSQEEGEGAPPAAAAAKSDAAVDDEDPPLDLESELDRTIASLISDESTATSSAGDAMSRSDSQHSHQRTDSDSSLASFEDAGAVIVEAKVVVPRSPVIGSGSGHRSHPSDSSIASSTSTDAEEGVVCLGERISCSYNVGVIGVAM
ncbi:hypothetical protein RHOSPDRAFT_33314 [Rhodotorula sp. JG-1b]|nr:hypothetical protein RHOSPDRAFT_33314 [Rhodotorula sp. JG-1b]